MKLAKVVGLSALWTAPGGAETLLFGGIFAQEDANHGWGPFGHRGSSLPLRPGPGRAGWPNDIGIATQTHVPGAREGAGE